MLSLVSDYGGGSGDEEEEENEDLTVQNKIPEKSYNNNNNKNGKNNNSEFGNISEDEEEENGNFVQNLGVVQQQEVEDSSESSSEYEEEEESPSKLEKQILNNPFREFGSSSSQSSEKPDSVFQIPFREEAKLKSSALEHHVKMTSLTQEMTMINGKKICWNHRKGKCRFGHNCQFAHMSDLQKTGDEINNETQTHIENSQQGQQLQLNDELNLNQDDKKTPPVSVNICGEKVDQTTFNREFKSKKKNTKRPGLSDNITPGKKAMKFFHSTKGNVGTFSNK